MGGWGPESYNVGPTPTPQSCPLLTVNDFLFCFTTYNLLPVPVNSISFSCCCCRLGCFYGHRFPPLVPQRVFSPLACRAAIPGGLQCLPLCTPIYCHPGLYSPLHLQPGLIPALLGQAEGRNLLLMEKEVILAGIVMSAHGLQAPEPGQALLLFPGRMNPARISLEWTSESLALFASFSGQNGVLGWAGLAIRPTLSPA